MAIKYCLPIIDTDPKRIQAIINDNLASYEFFEVWLDYIDDLQNDFIQTLCDQLGDRIILLFRRQNLEPINLSDERRLAIIDIISKSKALLDLDISQQHELEYIQKNNISINLLISYHNYESTPNTVRLEEIIVTMESYKPSIYKLATLCAGPQDALLLLQTLLELKASGKSIIVFGMGEHGSATRIFGTLWGNEMVFAPVNQDERTAEGQLTKHDLDTVFKALG